MSTAVGKRTWAWWIFVLGVLLVLEGLGWATYQALRFERREREARAEGRWQETIRLALWRLETELAPVLAQEAARPYFHYRASYPLGRAYEEMWAPPKQDDPGVMALSPLVEPAGLYTNLHYQVDAAGVLTSPQAVGEGEYAAFTTKDFSPEVRMLGMHRLEALRGFWVSPEPAGLMMSDAHAGPAITQRDNDRPDSRDRDDAAASSEISAGPLPKPDAVQAVADAGDFAARQRAAQSVQNYAEGSQNRAKVERAETKSVAEKPGGAVDQTGSDALTSVRAQDADQREQSQRDKAAKIGVSVGWPIKSTAVEQGPFEARWLQSSAASGSNSMHVELVIERHVRVGEHEVIQGVWLDWPALEAHLRSVIEDLLPVASLRPRARVNEPSSQDRWLAAIPAVIEPGAMPVVKPDGWSATRTTLLATWFAVLAAIGAIGWVLRSSMELSDRRGRFVSAVTHELRTPLTTFQLYTDMLASGMVDPASRDSYLKTLQGESARLSRLVENVLVFSRLSEGARPGGATEPVGELGAMLACVEPILQARAQQSGMRVEIIGDPDGARVRCDEASLERLLFNLVENSAKYAEGASEARIEVRVGVEAGRGVARIDVRDFGPGVPRDERARVFEAFYRSARDSVDPKAGMGLGLALARGLARQLGGDVQLVDVAGPGACFRVTLRLAGV